MTPYKPLLLLILDGFGVSLEKTGNPVAVAKTPIFNELDRYYPLTTLQASGVAVGLPWGEAGNSEVGHLTIGSGRVIYHSLPRIIYSIYDGSFFKNESFLKAVSHVRAHNSRLHMAGLVSSGSVHSYIDHLYALCEFAEKENLAEVYLHIFSDGRDAPPEGAAKLLEALEERRRKLWPHVSFSSIIGRSYALDRDEKWDRIEKAYLLLTEGRGKKVASLIDHVKQEYEHGIGDEFIEPAMAWTEAGEPEGVVKENDALIFFNFREDSMREITHAFVDNSFDHFPRKKVPNLLTVTMTEYAKDLNALPAFPPLEINWPLSRVLSEAGLKQLHVAETEKYAHVTYFLNGGEETPFPGEERILIPSLQTPHPDNIPEMKALEITAAVLENFDRFDVIIANFANADMVGHTGNFEAATQSVEILDQELGKILNAVLNNDSSLMLITGDHGNIELKRNLMTGEKLTEHSINPVPLYLVGQKFRLQKPKDEKEIVLHKSKVDGILTDVAPTMIDLLGLQKPPEMTGTSLLPLLLKQMS